jgi:hypothetical protein
LTVGIEATYWEKPSILAGVASFQNDDVIYNPLTHSELIELLMTDIPPKSRDATLKYGYYCKTFGTRYHKPTSLLRGIWA